jgi:hypothetical protein
MIFGPHSALFLFHGGAVFRALLKTALRSYGVKPLTYIEKTYLAFRGVFSHHQDRQHAQGMKLVAQMKHTLL